MPLQPVTFEHFEVARLPDGSLHELGRGAMGVTYKAFDTRLGSYVALKVINTDGIKSEVGRMRFEREAKAAAHLNHPNVAAIFHRGQEGGTYFYAMQFIEGETFDAFVKRRGPLPAGLALRLILQAAQGLAAASTRGLIHRDIKPANLMLVHPDRDAGLPPTDEEAEPDEDELLVKVIDFGLAKYLSKPGTTSDVSLTGDRIVGTPHYMSPEQIDPAGREIDARADIYALGVTLWHLLAGNPPFRGTEYQVFSQHMNQSLPWEQLPAAVPAQVHDLLERMMAKDPAARPASHRDLIVLLKQQLRTLAGGAPVPGGPVPPEETPLAEAAVPEGGPALPSSDFSLADVLQHRGQLTQDEVLGLSTLLAPIIDAKREQEGQACDLEPGHVGVRFDRPPPNPEHLLTRPIHSWPPSQLEIVTLGGGAPDSHPARALGSLVYTLLAGQPPANPYQPVASVNGRVNALLQQALEGTDAPGTATRFAEAFRLAQAGALHVPVAAAKAVSAWESETSEPAVVGSLLPVEVRQAWQFPWRGLGIAALLLALAAGGWWWFVGRGANGVSGWSLAQIPDYVRSSPTPPPVSVAATPAPAPVAVPAAAAPGPVALDDTGGLPVAGSIITRAVRRYAPPPYYPPAAKAARQQGRVLLNVDVDAAGNVTAVSVKASSGFPLLDEAALQTARVWKFDPARTNEVAVASRTEQPVEFKVPGSVPAGTIPAVANPR